MKNPRNSRSRFNRPVFLWALVALGAELAVGSLIGQRTYRTATRVLLLLPLVPALFFLLALAQAIWKMDELQRRICLESMAIAFTLTLAIAFIFAALEQAAVYRAPWDETGSLMMLLWACAYIFSAWRYR